MGYCAEHGQRLLIYEYCSNRTLQDALHSDDEFKRKLTWNIRIRMALGAARALEYLHKVCERPIIHLNFKSTNILLKNELVVYVSDCGLASLISSGSVSQVETPELGRDVTMCGGSKACQGQRCGLHEKGSSDSSTDTRSLACDRAQYVRACVELGYKRRAAALTKLGPTSLQIPLQPSCVAARSSMPTTTPFATEDVYF
ncbi:STRUBBELIG-receptor family 3 [Actinidia rufa]|uniref:STRUBBELIG-receptor family 3 n=1 Tax=Actinidia rufa TaxID=165716 RepID=A0A7J0DRS5_9ERIC|nr:STRUBBELIG-receptor family 3 [Actinidia rufa]